MKKATHHKAKPHPKVSADELWVEFETPEFTEHSRNELWYIGIGLLLLVVVVIALGVANYLLIGVAIAAGLAIFRVSRLQPRSIKVIISPDGIQRDDKLYAFSHFTAFWTSEEKGRLTVYLDRPNFMPTLHFFVPDEAADKTLTFLSLELPFHYHKDEPVIDRLGRMLKI